MEIMNAVKLEEERLEKIKKYVNPTERGSQSTEKNHTEAKKGTP